MPGKTFDLSEQTLPFVEEFGDRMPGGFLIYRAEAPEELIYANKACIDIFGCDDLEDFKKHTGFTFKGIVHPDDYDSVSGSIGQQISENSDNFDHVEYRIIRKDGSVRWVDDYGHFAETKKFGGIYYVFLSDITETRKRREQGELVRDAVIKTLTNTYNTVWLIMDVETEECALYHTDMDEIHSTAIRNALSHAKYTDTKTEYVNTMIAEEDRERLQVEMSLPYILEQFKTRQRFSVTFLRDLPGGKRFYRIHFGKVYRRHHGIHRCR